MGLHNVIYFVTTNLLLHCKFVDRDHSSDRNINLTDKPCKVNSRCKSVSFGDIFRH